MATAAFALPSIVSANCDPNVWDGAIGAPGANGSVRAFAVRSSTSSNVLIAGGFFSQIGGVTANRVARWTGTTWQPYGGGFSSGTIWALSTEQTSGFDVVAGGVGGTSAGVFGWTGSSWYPMGGGLGGTYALETMDLGSGPRLVAGGNFTTGNRIAQYDPGNDQWNALGTGFADGTVFALKEFNFGNNRVLFAAGDFTLAGGTTVNRVARWNGTNWQPVGGGFANGVVYALEVYDDGNGPALYAGGSFTVAGGSPANRVARWNGISWTPVEGGFPSGTVRTLHVHNDGNESFLFAGGSQPGKLSRWDGHQGSSWENLGAANSGEIFALEGWGTSRADLFAGGLFSTMGGLPNSNIARLSGCGPSYRDPPRISARMLSATMPGFNGYIIASDVNNENSGYNRDTIPVVVEARLELNGGVSASGSYRVALQLLDENDLPILLEGQSGPTQRILSPWQNVFVSHASGSVALRTFSMALRPASEIPAFSSIRVQATLIEAREPVTNTLPLGERLRDLRRTFSTAILHFTSLQSNDDALNVRTFTQAGGGFRSHMVETIPGEDHFRLGMTFAVYRYDGFNLASNGPDPVAFHFDVTVRNESGDIIPLENSRITVTRNIRRWNSVGGLKSPANSTEQAFLEFRPSGQLDSVGSTYEITIVPSHTERPASPPAQREWQSNSISDSGLRLLHFNGNLLFNDVKTILSEISGNPSVTNTSATFLQVALGIPALGAFLESIPDYALSDGSALGIQLLPNGDARVSSGSRTLTVADPQSALGEMNGVTFFRSTVTVNTDGANTGVVLALLPAGFGLRRETAASELRLLPFTFFLGGALDTNLRPKTNLTFSFPLSDRGVFHDDAHPIGYHSTSITWFRNEGRMALGGVEAIATNKASYEAMESYHNMGYIDAEDAILPSNDGHYRNIVGVSGSVSIKYLGDGHGALETTLLYGSGSYHPHFPRAGEVSATSGRMVLQNGAITPALSYLDGVAPLDLPYRQSCPEPDCTAGSGTATVTFVPDGNRLNFTSDGGLHAKGVLPSPIDLKWGAQGGGDFAYQVGGVTRGNLHLAGHQTFRTGSPLDTSHLPTLILYGGVSPTNLANYERPASASYKNGLADYAGFNVRSATDASGVAISRIGSSEIPFLLTNRSKFHTRAGGVTGIYEAQPGTFGGTGGNLTLYNYSFLISRYGLNFRFGSNGDSLTNGSIAVPAPAGFIQDFESMTFTCLGALDQASPPDGADDSKSLAYWQAEFDTHSIQFAQDADARCGDADAFLTIALSSTFGVLDTTLHGVVGFHSNGNILSWQDAIAENLDGLTSRLHLPPTLAMAGPEDETYYLNPVNDLYFNDAMAHQGPGAVGFITFAATSAVPFFRDLQIQVMTSARATAQSAPIYLAGGWPTDGWRTGDQHFFSSSRFDQAHRAFPTDVLSEYRSPTDASSDVYLVRAVQSWLDVVPFNYPLIWNNTLRTFRSKEVMKEDFFVVKANHRVERMTPNNVELVFGASYDGLPQINLASIAISAVDDATGAASAVIDSVGNQGRGMIQALAGGVDSVSDLLRDRMDTLFEPVLDRALDGVIDGTYSALKEAFDSLEDNAQGFDSWQEQWAAERLALLQGHLISGVGDGQKTLVDALAELAGLVEDANGLIGQVDQRLARVQLFIAGVIDKVNVDEFGLPRAPYLDEHLAAYPGGVVSQLPGLLAEIAGERQILRNLIGHLILKLSPSAADALGILNEQLAALEDRVNSLLARADPTIDRIIAVLERADQEIQQLRDKLKGSEELATELRAMFASAAQDIDDLADQVRDAVDEFFDQIERNRPMVEASQLIAQIRSPFDEFDPEEIKQMIRREIHDRFYQTALIDEVQQLIKAHLYEVDAIIKDAVDTALHTVNHVIRDLLSGALTELDDSINGMLGPLSELIGTGDIAGYAHIQGEAIRLLRLDGRFEWQVPSPLIFQGYLQIRQFDSAGPVTGCADPTRSSTEIEVGALDVPLGWISEGMRADVMTRFAFQTTPQFSPTGLAGSFSLTGGVLDFEAFTITKLGAAVAFGAYENYISASTEMTFSDYRLSGGIFFGRTCTLAPIALWDPLVATILDEPAPTFTGGYVYGEGWIPISETLLGIPASCMFRISAGVGAGAFFFAEGPTYGGRFLAGVSGEALCLVQVHGEISLIGLKQADDFRFSGTGRFGGSAGKCPFCIKFSKSAKINYRDGNWNIDL